jgi:hypothetical protein
LCFLKASQQRKWQSKRRAESGDFLRRIAVGCGIDDLNDHKLWKAVNLRIGVRSADLKDAQAGLGISKRRGVSPPVQVR